MDLEINYMNYLSVGKNIIYYLIEETHDFVSESFDAHVFDEHLSKESFGGIHFLEEQGIFKND